MKTPNEKRFDRRSFIKAGGTGLTGLAFARRLRAQSAARGQDYSGRRVYPLNHRWLYSDRAVPGGTSPGFDDRGLARVNIPHTNRLLPWHGFDDKEYQFVSLYRRHFRVPADLQRRGRHHLRRRPRQRGAARRVLRARGGPRVPSGSHR